MAAVQSFPLLVLYFSVLALAALWSAVFLQGKFAPTLKISESVEWLQSGMARVTTTIENVGFVRCNIGTIRSKVYATEPQNGAGDETPKAVLTEWVDFGDADLILRSTTHLNPKEQVCCDRIYALGSSGLLHVATQVVIDHPWYIHALGTRARSTRQTKAIYACKPSMLFQDRPREKTPEPTGM